MLRKIYKTTCLSDTMTIQKQIDALEYTALLLQDLAEELRDQRDQTPRTNIPEAYQCPKCSGNGELFRGACIWPVTCGFCGGTGRLLPAANPNAGVGQPYPNGRWTP